MSGPPPMVDQVPLRAEGLRTGYGTRIVSDHLDISIPRGGFTVIVGPNACGKSTLLRSMSRLLPLQGGAVYLDGRVISRFPSREVARRLGVLPQTSIAPDGITVADLVARGRHPHQSFLRQWSSADEEAVVQAMEATDVSGLSMRFVDELSGGQRQRVWMAMVLAQQTELLLLDEPTTFLDLANQVELLELIHALHREGGRTVVAVLHDLNQACRYATHIVAMRDGEVVIEGAPADVVTSETVREVFGLDVTVVPDPLTGSPMVVPARVLRHLDALGALPEPSSPSP